MARHLLHAFTLCALALCALGDHCVRAAQPAAELLPATTKGYLSIPDLDQLRANWEQTQLGEMMNDPVMQPFLEDLREQLRARLNQANAQLGITWEDLENAYGGEVCIALIQPWDPQQAEQAIAASVDKSVAAAKAAGKSEKQIAEIRAKQEETARQEQERQRLLQKALVLLVDVTGHQEQAEALLERIADQQVADGATRAAAIVEGVEMAHLTLPLEEGETVAREAYYGIHQDRLIATDHRGLAESILARLAGGLEQSSLLDLPAFHAAMAHCSQAMGDTPTQIRWFLEPFGYVEVSRAYNGGRKKRGTDLLRVLASQGFTAIQGLGGQIALSTGDHEILHRTFVYAPPLTRQAGDGGKERYDLAANMLDFPNTPALQPQNWIYSKVATYLSFNWRMQEAFEHSKTLVDEIVGDQVFDDVLKSIETDPNGPQINIRKELVAHLAERATLIADYREPVTPESERILFAIELTNPVAVMQTVNKAMESDPAAKKRVHDGHVIWEILNEEDPAEVETVQIDFGFGFEPEPAPVAEEEEPFMPNSAVTVAHGHLLIGSHMDYIVQVLQAPAPADQLDKNTEYARVSQALEGLGAGDDSFRLYSDTERAYHTTYELLRQGKMPEAETILGKLLNRLFGPEEEDELRQQFIDGTNMPPYDEIRKYLGPAGTFIHSHDDGWSISGCLLEKV